MMPGSVQEQPPPVPPDPQRGRQFGVVGAVLTALGAIAVLVSFTTVDWLKFPNTSFSLIHHRFSGAHPGISGLTQAYFSWVGWLLFGLVFVAAFCANLPQRRLALLRPIGFALAVVAIGLTFWAISFSNSVRPTYLEYLRMERTGFYLAIAGFLMMGIGALMGARRR
jgi:hypothetical protein